MPDDITVSYELDQSGNVSAALQAVLREAALGALLTGLMVLLFLRDWRSAAIVVVTIPFALLAAVVALWGAGQTINIMTLGGLALAVGILVDEATVAIENIHTHLARGAPLARGVLDASGEVVVPRLLAMLSVVAVFVPSFFMTGVSAVAVRAAVARRRLRDDRVVLPVELARAGAVGLAAGEAPARRDAEAHAGDWVERLRNRLARVLQRLAPARVAVVAAYALRHGGDCRRGRSHARARDLSRRAAPASSSCDSARRRAPSSSRPSDWPTTCSTRSSRRRVRTTSTSRSATSACSPRRIRSTRSFCGPADRTKACCRWRSGRTATFRLEDFEEDLRAPVPRAVSEAQFSFEPGDIVEPHHELRRADAGGGRDHGAGLRRDPRVRGEGAGRARRGFPRSAICSLDRRSTTRRCRSTSIAQLAGQLGVTVDQVGRSFAAATSSSRFVAPNYWADPRTGIAFQVQVEVPQPRMTSLDDLRVVPVTANRHVAPAARRRRAHREQRPSSANTTASTDSAW